MKFQINLITIGSLLLLIFGYQNVNAQEVNVQENIAQEAYAIFAQNCLGCHGASGAYKDSLLLDRTALVDTQVVIPGNPEDSEFYKRLLGPTENGAQMPLNLPALSQTAIETIARWIDEGAPDWDVQQNINFIATDAILDSIQTHLASLDAFDRPSARYFTLTHLYNAGESPQTLSDYRIALSKLVNSLSWKFEITNPTPVDAAQTIFYIDLRRYEWNTGADVWALIEQAYPYNIEFDSATQPGLLEKLTQLRTETGSTVPFVQVDWFLATASLPPLYHDILDLPLTDRVLEAQLDVNVTGNIRNAPGISVWRAGFNDSGVSANNRVVERHTSPYGAYWKSYDFAGSAGSQNIFTHPLDFTHDGGEIIFNLPNGLQAYCLVDANGNRLDIAPIDIVSNPAATDPTVRNGLSCIGCHDQGMRTFKDSVRAAIEQDQNPPYDKTQALRLYPEQSVLDGLVQKDTQRFLQALEKIGGPFADDESRQRFFKRHENEPIQRFHEAFQRPLDASHAAAAVGLETSEFLTQIREKQSLKNLGLQTLIDENGTVKRDAWTSNFADVISALTTPDSGVSPTDPRPGLIPGEIVDIPDVNLRTAIETVLGKTPGDTIIAAEMATLERLELNEKDISDLTGLEFAINLNWLDVSKNNISDLSPIAGLIQLSELRLTLNPASDLSPLKRLKNLTGLWFADNRQVADISPLADLINLEKLHFSSPLILDLSPLTGLTNLTALEFNFMPVPDLSILTELVNLEWLRSWGTDISDLSPLMGLTKLVDLDICGGKVSDLTPLASLTGLKRLDMYQHQVSDISPLANLTELTSLVLNTNNISDISPLAALTNLRRLLLNENEIVDISPLAGLINLRELQLKDNPVSDFSPLDELLKNPEVKIYTTEIDFPDPNLRAALEAELGKASGDTITALEMATLEKLNLNGKDINDLTGLEFAIDLNWLAINDNNIPDFSPIAGLAKLTEFRFHRNPVSDLSPLAGLKNLTGLWFADTQVADLTPLAGLINLEKLDFASRHISDLSPLKNLKNLTLLWPRGARVSDLSPIAELTNVKSFLMWGSPVSDLSPFAGFTQLEHLDICGARISDLTPVADLTNLKVLRLADNKVSDLLPIAGLTGLTDLELRDNNVTDVSPIAGLTGLTRLGLNNNNISDFSPLDGIRENLKHFIWHGNPGFPEGGPKIAGPWLWVNFPETPVGVGISSKDFLSEASKGTVTEENIAINGAIEGKSVGSSVWTSYKLLPTGRIAEKKMLADVLNLPSPVHDDSGGILYGFVSVYSPREQETTMYLGAQGGLKAWLNGTVVFAGGDYGGRLDSYTQLLPVTLQHGKNVILIKIRLAGSAFVGFESGTEYTVSIPSVDYVLSKTPIHVDDTFTLDIRARDVYDMAGWQFNIDYDPTILEAVDVSEGDFLKTDSGATYFPESTIDNTAGKITGLSATLLTGTGVTGTGTLLSVTFFAKAGGETQLTLNNFQFGTIMGETIPAGPRKFVIEVGEQFTFGDVNRDGQVSVLDMITISQYSGQPASAYPQADVNGDGTIDIRDLILVSQNLSGSNVSASPSNIAVSGLELNPAMIQEWITAAQAQDDGSIVFRQGIENLQKLLASLIPEKTALLPNYPNPFNPETWIPYRLAKPADVAFTIYGANGAVVRTLALGHQAAGIYQSRSRAAYWDGRNALGESVASGVYFYTLTAGEFSATRKMLIMK